MVIYYFTFLIPFLAIYLEKKIYRNLDIFLYLIYSIFLSIYIGFRDKIGGDWEAYYLLYVKVSNLNFFELFNVRYEFGYLFINWLVAKFNLGIHYVNFISAVIFVTGLSLFCYFQPYKWLGLLIATPYLINVVSMGATKQSIAIGFLLLSFISWQKRKSIFLIIFFIILSSLFHQSAILLLFLTVPLFNKRNIIIILFFGTFLFMIVFQSLFLEYKDYFFNTIRQTVAKGALIKILMNVSAALLFISVVFNYDKFKDDKYLYLLISLLATFCLFLIPIASAAAERFSIYFIPLQIIAITRTLDIIKNNYLKFTFLNLIILAYFGVFIVWFYFSFHIYMHVPYKFIEIG